MIDLLFPSPEQKVAAIRSMFWAVGSFLLAWVGNWVAMSNGLTDKEVIGPALVVGLGALFGRAVIEGQMDKGKGNA